MRTIRAILVIIDIREKYTHYNGGVMVLLLEDYPIKEEHKNDGCINKCSSRGSS